MQNPIPTLGKIEWRNGQPYSSTFQDVFFSSDNGLLETDYVFLKGNDLTTRWLQLTNNSFTIAETGFGTGLNFLCAAKLWLATAPKSTTLHFISVEKYPLSLQDITSALLLWPDLTDVSTALLAQYDTLAQGKQTILLFDKINGAVGNGFYIQYTQLEMICNYRNT